MRFFDYGIPPQQVRRMIVISNKAAFSMIYLLRHGETLWNTEKRLQGHSNSPLTDKGCKQAIENGRLLRPLLEKCERWRMIVSPLGRCRQSADLIAREVGFQATRMEFEDRLKELSFGRWEGMTVSEIEKEDRDGWVRRKADRWSVPAPGGENYRMAEERLSAWLSGIDEEETLVVVGHGATGRLLRGLYSGLSRDEIVALPEPQKGFYKLSHKVVTFIGGDSRMPAT